MKKKYSIVFTVLVLLFTVGVVRAASPKADKRSNEEKIKSCQDRQEIARKQAESLNDFVSKAISNSDKNLERVEKFYEEERISDGLSVPNYDALIAEVTAKKEALKEFSAAAGSDSDLSCAGDNPTDEITQFQKDIEAVRSSLKDYQDSINAMFNGLKEIQESKPTPFPTSTGSVSPTIVP